jgi:hypothetical protein
VTDLAKLVVRLEAETARYQSELEKARKGLGSFQRGVDGQLRKVQQAFAATAAAAVAGFGALVKGAVDAADQTGKLAQKVGVSTESLSQLGFAAGQSGTDIKGLENGLKALSRVAVESSTGSKQAAEAFAALGISATDANGQVRGTEELLLDIADKFSQFEDSASKAALAQRLFGRAGLELIPLLNNGRDGIEALKKQADALGLTITDKTAKAAALFNDSLDVLRSRVVGLARQTAADLLPALAEAVDGFAKSATGAAEFDLAGKVLANGLRLLVTVGFATFRTFADIGRSLGALAASAVAFARGEWTEARDIIVQAVEDQKKATADANMFLDKLWADTGARIVETAKANDAELKKTLIFGGGAGAGGGLQEISVGAKKIELGPIEQFYRELDELTKTSSEKQLDRFNEVKAALDQLYRDGIIGAEIYNARLGEAVDRLLPEMEVKVKKLTDETKKSTDELTEYVRQAQRNTVDIIADGLREGFDGGVRGILRSVADMLVDITAQIVAADLGRRLFGDMSAGSSGGGIGGWIGKALGGLGGLFGGSRDSGGRGMPGMSYLIGTGAQPELFVPDSAGTFVPAGAGGMTVNNYFTVQAPQGAITRQTESQIAAAAARGIGTAARRNN